MSDRASRLHASPWLGVLYLTGGGSPFLAEVLSTPGASATVLEASVPYAQQALAELLKGSPEQAASETTARQIAMAAFARARALHNGTGSEQLFGLGLTAGLATNRTRKGAHRAHWVIQTANSTFAFNALYEADRATEEALLNEQIWASIETALHGGKADLTNVTRYSATVDSHLASLLGNNPMRYAEEHHDGLLILPGSFNPIHDGHRQMLAVAERMTDRLGAFELTVRNADKPGLDFLTLEERILAIEERPVWLTNVPTYAEKAALFPGTTFILGVDTLARIGQLRFYQNREDLMETAIHAFVRHDCHFIVFGRQQGQDFHTLKDLNVPIELKHRCTEVPEDQFRHDVSSTQIRLLERRR